MGRDGRRDALAATAARPGGRAALSTVPEYANTATAAAGWVGSSFPNLYGSGYNQGAPVLTFFGQYNGPGGPTRRLPSVVGTSSWRRRTSTSSPTLFGGGLPSTARSSTTARERVIRFRFAHKLAARAPEPSKKLPQLAKGEAEFQAVPSCWSPVLESTIARVGSASSRSAT